MNDSEWASPKFIQPKKTGDVRVLTDVLRAQQVVSKEALSSAQDPRFDTEDREIQVCHCTRFIYGILSHFIR